jgi:hypothetical protein
MSKQNECHEAMQTLFYDDSMKAIAVVVRQAIELNDLGTALLIDGRQEYAFLHFGQAFSLLKNNLKSSLSYDSLQASTVVINPSPKPTGYDVLPLQEDGNPAEMAGLHHPTFFVYNRPFTKRQINKSEGGLTI